jgi:hypothetical protein
MEAQQLQLAMRNVAGVHKGIHLGLENEKLANGFGRIVTFILVVLVLQSCENTTNHTKDAGSKIVGNIVIANANNFSGIAHLSIPVTHTQPGVDLQIFWDNLSSDLLCHQLIPTKDIDSVTFAQVESLSKDEIATGLAAGKNLVGNVNVFYTYVVDHTSGSACATLSSFTSGSGTLLPTRDYVLRDDMTYLLLFKKGTMATAGIKSMMFLEPTVETTDATAFASEGCKILNFTPELVAKPAVDVPIAGQWVADWTQLTVDGLGNKVGSQTIDRLMLAYYEGKTKADLQEKFLDLEIIPTLSYGISIPQGIEYADLATARDATGQLFQGFGEVDGIWAIGLFCDTCSTIAPVALVTLNLTES